MFLSTYQGDSGGVLMMQAKSGSERWIQVFTIRRLIIRDPSENLHFWPVHEINWGACHSMQALSWSQVILLNFNFEVGVYAYVVNAYVNGIIVESHFKAVRWKSFSFKSNQDWWFMNPCWINSFSYSDPFPQGEFLPGLDISNHRFGWIGLTTSS